MTESHREPPAVPGVSEVSDLPPGAPRRVAFGGLLDGRRHDEQAARAALAALRSLGVAFDLEQSGGRFSVMLDDAPQPGAKFDEAGQASFVEAIDQLVAAAEPGSAESTLRCVLHYEEQVVETLFVVHGGTVRPMSRIRPRQPGEGGEGPPPNPGHAAARRKLLMTVPLLAIAFALLAWQSGLVDNLLATSSRELVRDTAAFGANLEMTTERSLRGYVVTLRRGPDYLATVESGDAARDAATTPVERAAISALLDGGTVWVRLQDDAGKVLEAAEVELAPLLAAADAESSARLPGRIGAAELVLALDAGRKR